MSAGPSVAMAVSETYRSAALSDGGKNGDKVQRGAVGQVELERTENFALHAEELLLCVRVVHQVAE